MPRSTLWLVATQLQGKELSYNNFLDTDACWTAVREFAEPCCVIVKHTNPCARASTTTSPLPTSGTGRRPISAYGGVMAFKPHRARIVVEAINENKQFVEVMIGPGLRARKHSSLLSGQADLRVLRTGGRAPTGWPLR